MKFDKKNFKINAKYLPDDKDFSKPPKLTWLTTNSNYTLNVTVLEFDHLLNEKKPDASKDFT